MEFTNGNYYLVDILEIALLAEESGNVCHYYVMMGYSVPKQVQLLTGITNRTIDTHGLPFRNVMGGLVELIRCERRQYTVNHYNTWRLCTRLSNPTSKLRETYLQRLYSSS